MEYELLMTGEVIEASDEFLEDDCLNWTSAKKLIFVGKKYNPGLHVPFRRPKQPKVLTPDEWLRDQYPEKYSGEYIQTGGYHDSCMHFAFESGEKQGIKKGRLERDQELRQAIELAVEVKKLYWESHPSDQPWRESVKLLESKLQQLDDELNNLKPVSENGK